MMISNLLCKRGASVSLQQALMRSAAPAAATL